MQNVFLTLFVVVFYLPLQFLLIKHVTFAFLSLEALIYFCIWATYLNRNIVVFGHLLLLFIGLFFMLNATWKEPFAHIPLIQKHFFLLKCLPIHIPQPLI